MVSHYIDCAQVRVLEMEGELSRERERLGQLRRAHYHLAAETEVPPCLAVGPYLMHAWQDKTSASTA